MKDYKSLADILKKIDGKSYGSYQDIKGSYLFLDFTLIIDQVQGDPFASPSWARVQIPQNIAGFPSETYLTKSRNIALRDYLTRQFRKISGRRGKGRGTGKSGEIQMPSVGQEILERTSTLVSEQMVEGRFTVGLPAAGRRILGLQAMELLCEEIPKLVNQCFKFSALDKDELNEFIRVAEDADFIRNRLFKNNLIAFVGNGSILPRRSGADQRPLEKNPVSFQSPPSLQVAFDTPNHGTIEGMGIPAGITLIVGGGFHGKSTLLEAISRGVYNHIPGDGREWVVASEDAVKVKAEDGRSVQKVDISPFIGPMPGGSDPSVFSTSNASGSTSQAANIIEALEAGAKTLIIDEDTSATNFMIRDRRMQELIAKDKEPITPFVDKIKALYDDHGVSTLIVMGGSGDYFDVADLVIGMDNYRAADLTEAARLVADRIPTQRKIESGDSFGVIRRRKLFVKSLDPGRGKKSVSVKTRKTDSIGFGREEIDLSAVDQLVDNGQLRAIAEAIIYIRRDPKSRELTLPEILYNLDLDIQENGIQSINSSHRGDLVRYRPFELAAAINRLRGLIILD